MADGTSKSKKAASKQKSQEPTAQEPKKTGRLHLFTGFPGYLAHHLVQVLFSRYPDDRLVALVQPHLEQYAGEMIDQIDRKVPGFKERARIITGDITQRHLGLEEPLYQELTGEVNQVWHLAAIYDLAVREQLAYRVNVLGTANILDFCQALPSGKQLNYVSTCYVSGDRTGLILESELDEGQGFKNHYESTKARAEMEVQRRRDRIPSVIFRPGIVVGDSRTGETDKYDGPYYLIKMLLNLPDWMPMVNVGKGEAFVNITPLDFTIDAMVAISQQPGATGKVYQLADPNPMSSAEIMSSILRTLGRRPPILSVPGDLLESALKIRSVRRLMGMPREVIVYFNHDARHDPSNTLQALEGTGISCPHLSSYMDVLVDFVKKNPHKDFLDRRRL
ncbi:MAG: SDR family oxidoreductase [Bradymonadales bacterium]|nr:SDR family oxidoreductase [Bradymonadales bacterium]